MPVSLAKTPVSIEKGRQIAALNAALRRNDLRALSGLFWFGSVRNGK
ncbi:hypothetical protein SEA_DWAYNE_72 [Streptomyces phage Dwayne]|nr:hypothetical protein SEA_DWAYNE_72 [Streptomyces phage Dwayne]